MELKPNTAYLITERGEVNPIVPANGKTFKLHEAQKGVDGYIEVIRLSEDLIMIVNEEGKFSKGYNEIATQIAEMSGALNGRDYVVGNVIMCPSHMLP